MSRSQKQKLCGERTKETILRRNFGCQDLAKSMESEETALKRVLQYVVSIKDQICCTPAFTFATRYEMEAV